MWPLAIIAGGLLFWAWWTRRLKSGAMVPLLLGLLALSFLARGQLPIGLASGVMAGLSWFLQRKKNRLPREDAVFLAEQLLGLPPEYEQFDIELAYRERAKSAHPDMGGNASRMNELTAARRLLTQHLRDTHRPK